MASLSFTIKGASTLSKELDKAPQIANKWLKRAMYVNVLDVKSLSQRYTPVDTGHLRGSIRTKVVQNRSRTLGMIWYLAKYAIYVHERTWTKLRNGRHKFLEVALFESRAKIEYTYYTSLKRAFREAFE